MEPRKLNKVLSVIVAVLVIVVVYLALRGPAQAPETNTANMTDISVNQAPTVVSPVVTPEVTPTATPAVDTTTTDSLDQTTWQTYANTKYGYEFKRPANWLLADCPSCTTADVTAATVAFNSPNTSARFAVETITTTKCLTLKSCATANRKVFASDQSSSGFTTFDAAGEPGLSEIITRTDTGGLKYTISYFLKNKTLYIVTQQSNSDDQLAVRPLLEAMLSTLKLSVAEASASALKTYSNSTQGFSVGYTTEGRIVPIQDGVRIENLPIDHAVSYQLRPGDYYLEVLVQTGTQDCAALFSSSRKITVDGVDGLRGPAKVGSYSGHRYLLCFNKGDKTYTLAETEGDTQQNRPKSILDSFHFLK